MPKPFVVDASVAGGWLLPDEQAPMQLLESMAETTALVPSIFHTEVCNLMAMAVRRARIGLSEAVIQMESLGRIPLRIESSMNQSAVLGLASRHSLTAYDAVYLALSLDKSAILATRDQKLRAAAIAEGVETTTG